MLYKEKRKNNLNVKRLDLGVRFEIATFDTGAGQDITRS
jgi:hypothetical protein